MSTLLNHTDTQNASKVSLERNKVLEFMLVADHSANTDLAVTDDGISTDANFTAAGSVLGSVQTLQGNARLTASTATRFSAELLNIHLDNRTMIQTEAIPIEAMAFSLEDQTLNSLAAESDANVSLALESHRGGNRPPKLDVAGNASSEVDMKLSNGFATPALGLAVTDNPSLYAEMALHTTQGLLTASSQVSVVGSIAAIS